MRILKKTLQWLMGILYVIAGLNHFINPHFYLAIMPPYVPFHLAMVYISGVAEIVLGVGVLIERTRRLAAWGLIALLIAIVPANIHMAVNAMELPAWVLWIRVAFQGVFIAWAYWYTRPAPDA
jgi:uncharacterized membrane protein